ncbi:MAG TPA: MOSC domain-containing protein [Planctomycetaceae bacterium]|nr:MOSC domain-containing protein [Planctomycetaceae bacterium]
MEQTHTATGCVEWIGVSGGFRHSIEPRSEVTVAVGTGIDGDYHSRKRPGGRRQVTLIQAEHFAVIATATGRDSVSPELFRRNIVVRGIELTSLIGRRFRIGEALLEVTGPCTPCSRMDENLGQGGRLAMKGLGGLTAMVIEPGRIRVGDSVSVDLWN